MDEVLAGRATAEDVAERPTPLCLSLLLVLPAPVHRARQLVATQEVGNLDEAHGVVLVGVFGVGCRR